jgi:glucokinase
MGGSIDMSERAVLAGDVGGTHVRLARFRDAGGRLEMENARVFSAAEYPGLQEILQEYLAGGPPVDSACIGVAGVIRDGSVRMTNRNWALNARDLAQGAGLRRMDFINDLEANAQGVAELEEKDFAVLNPGEAESEGNRCLISAGTGLGEAGMIRSGNAWIPFHSEGGHVNISPRDETEIELLRYLAVRFGHVSYERLLSGPGLANIHAFLVDSGRERELPSVADSLRQSDPGRAITQAALSGESAACGRALDLFVSLYGSAAGNLALKIFASGGVYLGGGIAPKILERLRKEDFMEAYLAKGRLREALEKMPVKVILEEKTALLGAARAAWLRSEPASG